MKPLRQPVRGNKKSTIQPVVVTTEHKIIPKVSERTKRKRREERERRLNPSICSSTLNICGVACLYIFLVLCVLIGVGGIVVCAIYLNADSNTQIWKIIGIVLGAVICLIGIILILISVFKQTRNRSWKLTKEETLVDHDTYYTDDVEDLDIKDVDTNPIDIREMQETASSPIHFPSYSPTKAISTEPILLPEHTSIAVQTEENPPTKAKTHTIIDRSKKPSTTIETQTIVKSDPTDTIFFRRVPVPTAKVVVQQPSTKVMIVRVPNTAGELILQHPRELSMNDRK
ncbi:unnamed protein product [Adineta ricciae]|uniref:Uncharacterized protein n=1 Tax=Adineta ricciae TaxID=249248 RepID=A0A815TTS5_ADIRI|nr:unnamed protein product [Adineta ricciae]